MSKESSSSSGGIGFVSLLQVCLIVMKLAGIGTVQHWTWWWVWSPTWIAFAVMGVVVIVVGIISLFR